MIGDFRNIEEEKGFERPVKSSERGINKRWVRGFLSGNKETNKDEEVRDESRKWKLFQVVALKEFPRVPPSPTHTIWQIKTLIPSNLTHGSAGVATSTPSFYMKRDVTVDYKLNLENRLNLKSDLIWKKYKIDQRSLLMCVEQIW